MATESDCKHYRGTREVTCEAGINLRALVGGPDLGWVIRLPCTSVLREANAARSDRPCVFCALFDPLTPEEVVAEDAAWADLIAESHRQMALLDPLLEAIKRDHAGQDVQGVVVCPVCQGNLHFTHSRYNGHVWVRCETDGCVAVAE